MRAILNYRDAHLVVTLDGTANCLTSPLGESAGIFRAIEEQLEVGAPICLVVDFRDLTSIDGPTLRDLFVYLASVSKGLPVRFVGPGTALSRLLKQLEHRPPIEFSRNVQGSFRGLPRPLKPEGSRWNDFLEQFGRSLDDPGATLCDECECDIEPTGFDTLSSIHAEEREKAKRAAQVREVPVERKPILASLASADDCEDGDPAGQMVIDLEHEAACLRGRADSADRTQSFRPIEFKKTVPVE